MGGDLGIPRFTLANSRAGIFILMVSTVKSNCLASCSSVAPAICAFRRSSNFTLFLPLIPSGPFLLLESPWSESFALRRTFLETFSDLSFFQSWVNLLPLEEELLPLEEELLPDRRGVLWRTVLFLFRTAENAGEDGGGHYSTPVFLVLLPPLPSLELLLHPTPLYSTLNRRNHSTRCTSWNHTCTRGVNS
jgi:hypothetical protein